MIKITLSILLAFLFIACDHGIDSKPISVPTGFSGKVTFIGTWPTDIIRTHIVAFKNPLLSGGDFNVFNLKYVSSEIPNDSQFYYYSSLDSAVVPGEGFLKDGVYSYIAVAQSKTSELSLDRSDWFVTGLYYSLGDSTHPGNIIITEGIILEDIDIKCDFDNPPPQPPGGN